MVFFGRPLSLLPACLAVIAAHLARVGAFSMDSNNNLAVYWGQNSYGATNAGNTAGYQQSLAHYCQDDTIDTFPLAFLNVFSGAGGLPEINLANSCSPNDNGVFSGTGLANCQFLASDIKTCQAKGKIVTISLGGATGASTFASDADAKTFAHTIWNLFLGGSSSTRPFGDAVLDGIDLDIEGGSSSGYTAFVQELRSLFSNASKKYYITGAPQCPFPDAYLGTVINAVGFDALYVQYNNWCGLGNFNNPNAWDFGTWDDWAKKTSPNKNIKIYIGAPASPSAAGSGYVDAATLGSIAKQMRTQYSSFGGVMLWDASQAYANGRFDQQIKNALGGNTGSPPTTKPPTSPTTTTKPPSAPTTTKPPSSPTTTKPPSSPTTTKPPSSPTTTSTPSGSCGSVAAWVSNKAFTQGNQVSYNGHLWTAKWWSQADTPGGPAGVWIDNGPCVGKRANSRFFVGL